MKLFVRLIACTFGHRAVARRPISGTIWPSGPCGSEGRLLLTPWEGLCAEKGQ